MTSHGCTNQRVTVLVSGNHRPQSNVEWPAFGDHNRNTTRVRSRGGLHSSGCTAAQGAVMPSTSPCSPRVCQGGGNGLRTCQRARGVNTSLMLRRTDSTMLASDASGHIVLVPAPRIAHKRQLSFSRNQAVWSRSNASQLQNKKCKTFHSN